MNMNESLHHLAVLCNEVKAANTARRSILRDADLAGSRVSLVSINQNPLHGPLGECGRRKYFFWGHCIRAATMVGIQGEQSLHCCLVNTPALFGAQLLFDPCITETNRSWE